MRQSQLPLLGLLLALFLGSRMNLPGEQSIGGSSARAGNAGPGHQGAKIPPRTSNPASTAAESNSALAQTICRLTPGYNQTQATNHGFPSPASAVAPTPFPNCLPQLSDQQPIHILSLMAAIEDPIHTHLGMETDRTLDAIQAATAVASYNPYSHFLPWRPADATRNAGESAGSESDLHQPGLLIFRKEVSPGQPTEYLAVFLIPELPTTGLDQEAFFVAQQMMVETVAQTGYPTKDARVIRFVGPNFSGSMASFTDLDRVLHNSNHSDQEYSIHAFSGPITSPPDQPFANLDSSLKLTQTTDCEAINAFLSGVQEYGYSPEQVAVVSEEGTEFGNQADFRGSDIDGNIQEPVKHSCQIVSGPLFLHFPRDISKLRNAYGAQAGQTKPTTTTQSGTSQADVPVNWQDSEASQGDDVPAYGGQQTPLSQQAALSSLTGILRRANIRALGILATDPMDEAFLIRSFKKSSRDVRLFLRDPDLLYLRTLDAGSLNGTLLVSNYPLISQNESWSRDKSQKSSLAFPSAIQEAQYNAFLVALKDLAWIIHEVSSQERKDALKGMMNTGVAAPTFHFGASIA